MTDTHDPSPATAGHTFQVVVDAIDPHAQAEWWAATLQWDVVPQDEDFIRSMIAQGFATDADTTVHHGRLVWREGAAINAPGGAASGRPRMLFQAVPEAKSLKNRVHVDVRPTDGDVDRLRAMVLARGATKIGEGRQGPHTWQVFTDPEGNEFCI